MNDSIFYCWVVTVVWCMVAVKIEHYPMAAATALLAISIGSRLTW